MAQRTEFTYRNIELYKSESLGSGSYGGVCKAKCDGLLCAAKIMHPTLFDLRDPGTASYLRRFQEECRLLSLARHPNVVQYLATYYDPDTRLPVLLMELCDQSLTTFLEQSPGPLCYHIQINICHDIALALAYLHSNGLIHRDLTGNNVLMITGTRAKITDFGMSKLATVNPRMTALTLCPGNLLYMSPEALDEAKSYTAKLDIFSFGVIVIQILTREFPNPTDRFRSVKVAEFEEEVRVVVPETERRQSQLKLIPDTHSLKPVVLQCLKKEGQRPSALELRERLSELKQSSQYTESQCQTQSSSDIQQLQQQLRGQRILTETKTKEVRDYMTRITELESIVEEKQHLIDTKDRQLQEKERTIVSGDHNIVQMKERESQLTQQLLKSAIGPQTSVAMDKKDISKMTWREGKSAPEGMHRGAAVVHGNTAYFTPWGSYKVYSYQIIGEVEQWSQLPDNVNERFSLVIIDGLVTSVGGFNNGLFSYTLLSLTGEGERKKWSQIFPPMPTPRRNAACISTEQALVVAGGYASSGRLETVEVMNIDTKQWTTVSPLPQNLSRLSVAVCGDTLYLAGGTTYHSPSKLVFTCSIPELMTPLNTLSSRIRRTFSRSQNLWREISSLPVTESTLVSFSSDLLAIGGMDGSRSLTSDVYRYDSHTDSWNVVSQIKNKRSKCLAFTLPGGCIIVVGGYTTCDPVATETDSVEILE